jgi:hypothetical protein
MKKARLILGLLAFLFATTHSTAQDTEKKDKNPVEDKNKVVLKKDFQIEKHTIMERFETDYMVSADKRADMKKKRIADAEHTLSVLDTMDISDRKKRLLLRDLKYNPFSERLSKFIAETKFEEEATVDNNEK